MAMRERPGACAAGLAVHSKVNLCLYTATDPDTFLLFYRVRMKRFSILSITVAFVFVLAGCATASRDAASSASPPQMMACKTSSEQEVAALFDRWNDSLKTGAPRKVVANYASKSILLATVSNKPRLSAAEKEDYFQHFLENKPVGKIDSRFIEVGCNTALDTGLYTFSFGKTGAQVRARYTYTYGWDGSQWLITSHHSSAMPEKN